MRTDEFDYQLDPARIAQTPAEPRDSSRLMVVQRSSGQISHCRFADIADHLASDDLLIFNESRVIAARLFARKQPSGGRVELLLLPQTDLADNGHHWRALVKGRRVRVGAHLALIHPQTGEFVGIQATVAAEGERGERLIDFDRSLWPLLDKVGSLPLPPYIHETLDDDERYQTVYSRRLGSVAAPTAGLHFTPDSMLKLRQAGLEFGFVTLHIGLDTFRPLNVERVQDHQMHTETAHLSAAVARQINQARLAERRVVAVGTTVVRVLETSAHKALCTNAGQACSFATVSAFAGPTSLFITPGYDFRAVDALITNFHLPRSTLLMLVSAFAGLELTRRAYQQAIETGYRFYSFGDAMLIL